MGAYAELTCEARRAVLKSDHTGDGKSGKVKRMHSQAQSELLIYI
jgi:hypothetical protein